MRASRFNEEQIIALLREQKAGGKTADVVVSMGSTAPPSTSGSRDMGGWMCRMLAG